MLPGTPEAARCVRDAPRRTLPSNLLARLVQAAFPEGRALELEPLADGLRNSNFKLRIDSLAEPIVLRIYEHDPTLCQKELDLFGLLWGTVPVPEVIHAQPLRAAGLPPFALLRYVEGITFRELRRRGDTEAIAQAAHSAGETLAAVHRTVFPKSGWLAPGLAVTVPLLEGRNAMARFVDLCLASANLQRRLPAPVCQGVHALMWSALPELALCEAQTNLVHGDFNKRNLLVRPANGRWAVAAVLDWEFAVSSTPLTDLANFLRYERASRPCAEPFFSNGYRHAGGSLPEDLAPSLAPRRSRRTVRDADEGLTPRRCDRRAVRVSASYGGAEGPGNSVSGPLGCGVGQDGLLPCHTPRRLPFPRAFKHPHPACHLQCKWHSDMMRSLDQELSCAIFCF